MDSAAGKLPINEVVFAISFEEQELLAGPRLAVALQDLLDTYSDIEEQVPYEMPEELPTKRQLMKPSVGFQIIGASGPSKRRYWLTKPIDKSVLIQAQSNYFAVNWRRRPDGQNYPGFESLKESFFELLGVFQNTLQQRTGLSINVQQVELSYINLIKPLNDYPDHSFLQDVIDVQTPLLEEFEQLSLSYTRSLDSSDGVFLGRSYTNIQTGFQLRDDPLTSPLPLTLMEDPELTPVVNLSTAVRSARHKSLALEEISNILDYEHDEATRSFQAITTESAQASWGIE